MDTLYLENEFQILNMQPGITSKSYTQSSNQVEGSTLAQKFVFRHSIHYQQQDNNLTPPEGALGYAQSEILVSTDWRHIPAQSQEIYEKPHVLVGDGDVQYYV